MITVDQTLKDEYFNMDDEAQTLKAKIAMHRYTAALLKEYTQFINDKVQGPDGNEPISIDFHLVFLYGRSLLENYTK